MNQKFYSQVYTQNNWKGKAETETYLPVCGNSINIHQMFINWWKGKQIMVYIHTIDYYSAIKKNSNDVSRT